MGQRLAWYKTYGAHLSRWFSNASSQKATKTGSPQTQSKIIKWIVIPSASAAIVTPLRPRPVQKHSTRRPPAVRKTPSWPRSWVNFCLLKLHSHRNVWANLRLLGQPNTFLACGPEPSSRACSTRCPRSQTVSQPSSLTQHAPPSGPVRAVHFYADV